MIGTSTYSKRQGSYTCLFRPDSVGQEFIQRESEDGFFGAGFMRRPTVKLRRDPVEGRLSVAGLEAVLGGKSLPNPEESFQVEQPRLPVGSLQKTAFPAPVGSDVASALFPERHPPP